MTFDQSDSCQALACSAAMLVLIKSTVIAKLYIKLLDMQMFCPGIEDIELAVP